VTPGLSTKISKESCRTADGATLGDTSIADDDLLLRIPAIDGEYPVTLRVYDPERHRSLASAYAYDPRLAGLAGLAFALFQLGYPDDAPVRCCEAVDDAEQLSHPFGLAYALHHA
jgi:hypothetical protein